MSFLAHQAAYRTTRWAAWRLKNNSAIKAQRALDKEIEADLNEALARVFGPSNNTQRRQK